MEINPGDEEVSLVRGRGAAAVRASAFGGAVPAKPGPTAGRFWSSVCLTYSCRALITPVLLPFIPFRSFAVKGWIMGMLTILAVLRVSGESRIAGQRLLVAASYLFFPALSSYIALQFTGATTYTGMSGVNKELKTRDPALLRRGRPVAGAAGPVQAHRMEGAMKYLAERRDIDVRS